MTRSTAATGFTAARPLKAGAFLAVAAMAALLPGCTRTLNHQGYIVDQALVDAVQPGVDNRGSVERTLGRPSLEGGFDKRDWYYVARETRQFGYTNPKPIAQTLLIVHFDQAGNVSKLEKRGLEQAVNISPTKDKTQTLGGKSGLLNAIFGNIGAVGAGGTAAGSSGPSRDNPNGQ